jgi:hypothetical protein
MRASRAAWLVGLLVMAGGASTTYVTCPGCLDRDRMNKACEWTGDTSFPIDSRNSAQHKHLVSDAQLAEELAIRYADLEFGRRFGVEHHGGLLEGGRIRNECLARMFGAIEAMHGVTAEQVQAARGQRNWIFDGAVAVLFLPIYVLGSIAASRWLSRRLSTHDRLVRLIAAGIASVAFSVLGLQFLRLWGAVWETIRVGNGHMTSMRAASQTRWMHHVDGQLLVAILLFWLVALCCSRVWAAEVAGDEDQRPYGAILR